MTGPNPPKNSKQLRPLIVRMHHDFCMKWITDNHPHMRRHLWEQAKAIVRQLNREGKL